MGEVGVSKFQNSAECDDIALYLEAINRPSLAHILLQTARIIQTTIAKNLMRNS